MGRVNWAGAKTRGRKLIATRPNQATASRRWPGNGGYLNARDTAARGDARRVRRRCGRQHQHGSTRLASLSVGRSTAVE